MMSFTAEIYKCIFDDIYNSCDELKFRMKTRKHTLDNNISIVFGVDVISKMRSAFISIAPKGDETLFPHWKGVEITALSLPEYGGEDCYIGLTQTNSSGEIFEVVVQDLINNLEKVNSVESSFSKVKEVLAKWKNFFQEERKLLLSEIEQQGLYGELKFLNSCIKMIGPNAVLFWSGCEKETHDFYLAGNAVEIKTTSKNAPYEIAASSEYQFDDNDVNNRLFLQFYALRKSSSSGEKLPELVGIIRTALKGTPSMLEKFNYKLERYGFYDVAAISYTTGYYIRDFYSFAIRDGFPRLVKSDLAEGISNLLYTISLSHCFNSLIEETDLWNFLKGEIDSDK